MKKRDRERGTILFPVESAITAKGITTQMFRIMKTRACSFGQRVSSCPFASNIGTLGEIKTDESEPEGPFCRLHGRSVCKEWGQGGWGWPKYGPTPVRSKASDHDN